MGKGGQKTMDSEVLNLRKPVVFVSMAFLIIVVILTVGDLVLAQLMGDDQVSVLAQIRDQMGEVPDFCGEMSLGLFDPEITPDGRVFLIITLNDDDFSVSYLLSESMRWELQPELFIQLGLKGQRSHVDFGVGKRVFVWLPDGPNETREVYWSLDSYEDPEPGRFVVEPCVGR